VNVIDFRSDTVTWPTEPMRKAMAEAQVGDDVYGEDPTVNALESKAAELLGKEASLLVSSGTMGNLVAILSHTSRGDEAIAGYDTHAITYEGGGLSVLGGVVPRVLPTDDIGRMELSAIDAAVNPDDPHYARSRLILLENSYGARGGAPIPVEYFEGVRKIAIQHSLAIHLDGARIFNAAAALQVEAREVAAYADTVTFCLSKGLCAPIGSMLCASKEIIHKAHRVRKVLGGGMRQAGIIAAAGIVALEEMVDRLVEDNENAQLLGRGLKEIHGIGIDIERVRTNIIFFEIEREAGTSAKDVAYFLRTKHNILVDVTGTNRIRAVTHYWVGKAEIDKLVHGLEKAIKYAGESK
jgi:threonine aldolase